MIKGAAFTIPVSALPALEADPEIVSVTIDHPLKGMDDYTNAAMNASGATSFATTFGYDGTGVGVAVSRKSAAFTGPLKASSSS